MYGLKISKTFLSGMIGGFAGVALFFIVVFGFFVLRDRLSQQNISCVLNKDTTKRDMSCQIVEIRNRGNTLKVSEMLSPPSEPEELEKMKDKITTGKFMEVKVRVENRGKEQKSISRILLIDSQRRQYTASSAGSAEYWYWLPPESQEFWIDIGPGFTKEISQIFEVSKGASGFKLELAINQSSGLID